MLRVGQVCLFYLMLLWLGLMLLVGNVGLVPLVLTPRSFREPIVQQLISGLFRLFLHGAERCGLMRLDLGGLDVLNRQKNLLLVANHPSMIDVFLIVSRVHQAVCLMKASIGSNILFGVGAYLAGYVSNRQVDLMLRSATAALGRGPHLLVFPEGTRSIRLAKGHTGLAQMSQALGVTIVPVGCNGSHRLYPGGSPWASGGRVVYRIGTPLTPDGPELGPLRVHEAFEPMVPGAMRTHGERFKKITDLVMSRIESLLDPDHRPGEGAGGTREMDRFL